MTYHERLPMPFETAITQFILGQIQRRRRRTPAAAATLGEALRTFDRLGMPTWAHRARTELDRLHTTHSGGEQLTAGEHRTAALAATGRSNKQIAAELFIAEKTVEMNLSRVYRKLGIRSRAGLSAALPAADHDQGNP
jgi:DNA-binding CsgD family transcriptional regulator